MPCYTEPHSYCHHGIEDVERVICDVTNRIREFDSTRKREEGEFKDLKQHADKITDMLCRMITEYERYYTINSMGEDIEDWWKKHKELDAKRK
jgi:hypothetical protein